VPWLVADGFIANYQDILNSLPLILVTSNRVKEMYVRDGINADIIEVLPVGCDTDAFMPYDKNDPKILSVRESLGISTDRLMLLPVLKGLECPRLKPEPARLAAGKSGSLAPV